MFLTEYIDPCLGIKLSRLRSGLTAVNMAVIHLHIIYAQSSIGEELEANVLYKTQRERVC